jgi:hypothetical protein
MDPEAKTEDKVTEPKPDEVTETEEKTEQETPPENKEVEPEKTFTQSEVEAMFDKRTARIENKLRRELERQNKNTKPETKPAAKKEPELDDYEDATEWIKDHTKWVAENVAASEREKYQKEAAEREAKTLNQEYRKQQKQVAKKYPDYQDALETIEDYGDLPDYLNEAVVTSEVSGELTYYLGKNPDEIDKLLDLRPTAAVRYIGKLEDKISSDPPKKQVSNAPTPPPKMNTGGKSDTSEYKQGDPFTKFVKVRNKELGRV